MAQETYTLKNIVSMQDPTGKLAKIAEVLTEVKPIIYDVPWIQGNLDTGNRITRRKTLGTPTLRRFNEYVPASVTTVGQTDEVTAQLQDWDQVDVDLANLGGDPKGFRAKLMRGKMESMGQEFVSQLLYGNRATNPKGITGLITRANALNTTYGNGSPIVIDAGGKTAATNASILIVGWGPDKIYGIYPKNTMGGLKFSDKGEVTDVNTDGYMDVYRSKYSWDYGVCVEDYRYLIRIANIDTSTLSTIGTDNDTSPRIFNLLMDAIENIPELDGTGFDIYCPRKVWGAMNKQAIETGARATNVALPDAKLVSNVYGMPLKMLDGMLTTEEVVS